MKTSGILLIAAILLLMPSCQKDVEEAPPPPQEITTKILKEVKYYDGGTLDQEGYIRYFFDTAANKVYKSYDTVGNIHDRFDYDVSGRLVKVVFAFAGGNPTEQDSMIITRPNATTVHFEIVGLGFTSTATTTSLTGGRKLIHIENASTMPGAPGMVKDLYMSANGKLDSSIRDSDEGVYTITMTRRITYNASGVATTVTDVWNNSDAPEVSVYTNTITRDNNDNSFWDLLISRMFGTDLGWMAYDFESGLFEDEFFNDYWMTDNLMMMKGTMTSYTTNTKDYDKATGAMIDDDGSELTDFTIQYDINSRLKYHKEVYDGEIQKEFNFRYYN